MDQGEEGAHAEGFSRFAMRLPGQFAGQTITAAAEEQFHLP